MYANDAFQRHTGRWPHPWIIEKGKKYVRYHCWRRERELSHYGHIEWAWEVVEWCGFKPDDSLVVKGRAL